MESVNKTRLNELIEFLQPFKDASNALEEEKRPTLHLALLYASAYKNHLEHAPVSVVEAVEIEKIKARACHFLDTKLKSSLLHRAPDFTGLSSANSGCCPRTSALNLRAPMTQDEGETDDDVRDAASKKRRLGLFQDWCEAEDEKVETDELEEYLHGKKDYSCSRVFELCDFWRAHEKEFPKTFPSIQTHPVHPRVLAADGTLARQATSCKQGAPA
ncbi:hypothetical protein HPB47_023560 [Ixodes persulcatus]|uniref:Uncharacterized protein n=1 Tax=Ixodes persulcatus TaxID=34615 RepID=A0AC60Q984_IXOPE|nr:hypothetical protein HPB47_023560 [Ixodes persulcatus]